MTPANGRNDDSALLHDLSEARPMLRKHELGPRSLPMATSSEPYVESIMQSHDTDPSAWLALGATQGPVVFGIFDRETGEILELIVERPDESRALLSYLRARGRLFPNTAEATRVMARSTPS